MESAPSGLRAAAFARGPSPNSPAEAAMIAAVIVIQATLCVDQVTACQRTVSPIRRRAANSSDRESDPMADAGRRRRNDGRRVRLSTLQRVMGAKPHGGTSLRRGPGARRARGSPASNAIEAVPLFRQRPTHADTARRRRSARQAACTASRFTSRVASWFSSLSAVFSSSSVSRSRAPISFWPFASAQAWRVPYRAIS